VKSPARARNRGVVFQNHSLLPWLTCYENVHLAVERVFGVTEKSGALKERCAARARAGAAWARAGQVSARDLGGMKTARPASPARSSIEPKVLLLDEPVRALDAADAQHGCRTSCCGSSPRREAPCLW